MNTILAPSPIEALEAETRMRIRYGRYEEVYDRRTGRAAYVAAQRRTVVHLTDGISEENWQSDVFDVTPIGQEFPAALSFNQKQRIIAALFTAQPPEVRAGVLTGEEENILGLAIARELGGVQ